MKRYDLKRLTYYDMIKAYFMIRLKCERTTFDNSIFKDVYLEDLCWCQDNKAIQPIQANISSMKY